MSVQLFEQLAKRYLYNMILSSDELTRDTATAEYNIAIKDKKFLCFNKIHRGHRIYLLAKMLENGLVDDAYYSFEGGWSTWVDGDNEGKTISWDSSMNLQIESNQHRFPMRLNLTTDRPNPIDSIQDDHKYYVNSYFSVVTETIFYKKGMKRGIDANSEDAVFLSEKIFKPIVSKHPFVLVGIAHSLAVLRKMGYKTFYPFINESYDLEEDDDVRLNMIVTEIERLCAFSNEQWIEWQHQIKNIVEYNFNVIQSRVISNPDVFKTGLVK